MFGTFSDENGRKPVEGRRLQVGADEQDLGRVVGITAGLREEIDTTLSEEVWELDTVPATEVVRGPRLEAVLLVVLRRTRAGTDGLGENVAKLAE